MTTASDRLLILNIGTPSRLLSMSPQDGSFDVLVPDLGVAPDGIAIDRVRRHIYWTSMGTIHTGEDFLVNDGSIERVDFDGTNRVTIVPCGQTFTPKQMQCDSERGLIYWCDREGMRVMRARMNGSALTVLVETGSTEEHRRDKSRHCVGIAIDPEGGFLYWTQKGKPDGGEGRIFRAPLEAPAGADPSNRSDIELLFEGLPEPIDLEWVADTGHLYWTDRGTPPEGNTLNRSLMRPNEPPSREILLGGLREGIGLAIDRRHHRAFVADLGGFVRSVDLDRPGQDRVVFSGHGPITGIAYLDA